MVRSWPRRTCPPTRRRLADPLAIALALHAVACGGDPAPAAGAADSAQTDATDAAADAGCGLPGSSGDASQAATTEDLQIDVPHGGTTFTVRGSIVRANICQKAAPCPLIVVVGDRDSSPQPQWQAPAKSLASATASVVVVFNLPGTGIGGHASSGTADFGGDLQAGAVKEVMRMTSEKPYVDKTRAGFVTVGFGLVPTANALKIFGPNSLKFVRFLIDIEGPSDRCAASQAPANPGRSVGPDDGPGATEAACNFGSVGSHAAAYPPASGDTPAAIVCAPGAWPITDTGKDCTDNVWWQSREPARQLKGSSITVHYQRVQFRHDHRMPSYHASRVMMQAIAGSNSKWFALNDMPPCSAPASDDTCGQLLRDCQRCWLEGTWGTGLTPAPYAPAGDLQEITTQELFAEVLPRFVRRVSNPAESPSCR